MKSRTHDLQDVEFGDAWEIRAGTTYLNHGSFGPSPRPVRQAMLSWQQRMDSQPMDFFVRQFEPQWFAARDAVARLVHAEPGNLVLTENATWGMNVVANSFTLEPGDEVLLTNHEYGAVVRIWERACRRAGADPPAIARLPAIIESAHDVVDAMVSRITDRTRLIVLSHITSPSAIILPVQAICDEARRRGIATCIDGPHAPAQIPVDLDGLACDYYTASCHKWLSAPLGTGFLYVAPHRQAEIEPTMLSWGRLPPTSLDCWSDEFMWLGTRNVAALFALPAAIEFLESVGLERFRRRTHALAAYARDQIQGLVGLPPAVPDSAEFYGSMAHVPLPPGDAPNLQNRLWEQYGIEVPIIEFEGSRSIRVSCHLYNSVDQIDTLVAALEALLAISD